MLIAWMTGELRKDPNDQQGIREVLEKVRRGEAIIVSGEDPLKKEILLDAMDPEAVRKYNEAFRTRRMQRLRYDPSIPSLAGDIRAHYKKLHQKPPSVGDADHLAHAIHYGVDEFHTFDKGKKDGCDLLSLSGNVAGHKLTICKPPWTQSSLFPEPI